MKPVVSILTPTRGRPDWARRLIDSAMATSGADIEMVFYGDDDDPTLPQVQQMADDYAPIVRLLSGPRIVLSQMWNVCYEAAQADIVMQCGDDIVFRTPNWVQLVTRQFDKVADRLVLVHGRDGIQDDRVATHGFYSRQWVDTVGYFMPPYFSSDWNDMWWTEVADRIGRRVYLAHLYTEHMHPAAGKAPLDRTHMDRLERHRTDDVDGLYVRLKDERAADVQKLLAVIRGEPLPKPAPARWMILIATIGRRGKKFRRLLDMLLPQVERYGGAVQIRAYWNNGETGLADVRQTLVEHAAAAGAGWISFVDDDDVPADQYVERVMGALNEDPDYVGWTMQHYSDGQPSKPTYHDLAYGRWHDDRDAYYRDVSHLNPVRTVLAAQADFRKTNPPEDVAWSDQLREILAGSTSRTRQVVLARNFVAYHYYSTGDSTWKPGSVKDEGHPRVEVDHPCFAYITPEGRP